MTVMRLKEMFGRQPFVPFVVHLADGRTLSVRHPEMAMTFRNERSVVVFAGNGRAHVIDPFLVIDIELAAEEFENG